jgi:hypothetical protein
VPVVVPGDTPTTEVGPALYWYYRSRGWVQASEARGDRVRALVWAGDQQLWVEVRRAGLSDDAPRLEAERRAVRDRIVWMECLDSRDPGGGDPKAQMRELQRLTGQRLDTSRAWFAWWEANGHRLALGPGGRLVLAPAASRQAAADPAGEAAPPAILSLRVAREAPAALLLAIEYEYGGADASGVSIGAITLVDGASTGHWAYRPAPVFRGRHTAYVALSLNHGAPPVHSTNQIQTEMYARRRPVARAVFPLEKEWVKDGRPPG